MKLNFIISSVLVLFSHSLFAQCDANFIVPRVNGKSGSTIHFQNASTSVSPLTYEWSVNGSSVSTSENYDLILGATGSYNVCLLVEDGFGCSDMFCQEIQSINSTPLTEIIGRTGSVGVTETMHAIAHVSDAGGSGAIFLSQNHRVAGVDSNAVSRFDLNGSILWTRRYARTSAGAAWGNFIKDEYDHLIYTDNRTSPTAGSPSSIAVTRLSHDGDIIWKQLYTFTDTDNLAVTFPRTLNNGRGAYYLVGLIGVDKTFVVSIDAATGNVNWDRKFDYFYSGVGLDGQGGLILCSRETSVAPALQAGIAQIDVNGNVVRAFHLQDGNAGANYRIGEVTPVNDGYLLLAEMGILGSSSTLVLHTDFNWVIDWKTEVDHPDLNSSVPPSMAIFPLNDGRYFIYSTYSNPQTRFAAIFDASGVFDPNLTQSIPVSERIATSQGGVFNLYGTNNSSVGSGDIEFGLLDGWLDIATCFASPVVFSVIPDQVTAFTSVTPYSDLSSLTVSSTNLTALASTQFRDVIQPATLICGPTLPLSSLQLEAQSYGDNGTLLAWTTRGEIQVSHHELQRKTGNSEYATIHRVSALNQAENQYSFLDEQIVESATYRVMSVDLDGKKTYSNIVTVKGESTVNPISIYPNPTENTFTLSLFKKPSSILIFDALGRIVKSVSDCEENTSIDLSEVSAGTYYVQVITEHGTYHSRIVKK